MNTASEQKSFTTEQECETKRKKKKKNAGVIMAGGNSKRTVSKVDVHLHFGEQEVITNAFSDNETNIQEIERLKIGSNKICIREDLTNE